MAKNKISDYPTQLVDIKEITLNENNPRFIRDEKLEKLTKSVKEFPQMLQIRPIVVDKDKKILGGNMRYRACIEAGFSEVPIIIAENLTQEQELEFLIKDNISGGEWDVELLTDQFDKDQLIDWGINHEFVEYENQDLDEFFEENDEPEKDPTFKIVLEYSEEDYEKVSGALSEIGGTKENVIYDLLIK